MSPTQRVQVIVNAAMSADGKLALPSGRPLRLSGPEDHARVHRLRAAVDAVVVGVGTVLADDPRLTARPGGAPVKRQPLRVVLDSRGRTPPTARVLDDAAPTLVFVAQDAAKDGAGRPELPGADVVACGLERVDLPAAMEALGTRGVRRVLVEGGGTIIWAMLRAGLVDEVVTYVAPRVVGGRGPTVAMGEGADDPEDAVALELEEVRREGEGALLRYRVVRPAP